MENINKFKKDLSACVKCGACQSVCPVFLQLKRESAVARGKLALFESLIQGEIDVTEKFAEAISQCILCLSCKETCAAQISIEHLIPFARWEVLKKLGIPFKKHVALKALSSKSFSKRLLYNLLKILNPLLFARIPENSGLYYRYSFLLEKGRFIPQLVRKPFLERYREPIEGNKKKPVVLFFPGCMVNYLYPNIGDSVINILKRMECTILLPKEQNCCGFPALASGDILTSKRLAESNFREFSKLSFDAIVLACATCGTAFKNYDLYFRDFNERYSQWSEVKKKVFDISEFIIEFGEKKFGTLLRRAPQSWRATYHDPCHLKKSQGIYTQPREVISNLPGIEFIEMDEASSCCGFGGTFSLDNYELSLKINDSKIFKVMRTNAEKLLTACPGCIMQLQGGLLRHESKIKVSHWVEEITICS